jgi:hypothetical protein
MPVQWFGPGSRQRRLSFLRVPPRQIVCILEKPSDMVGIGLHWSDARRESLLCQGQDCLLCGEYVRKIHVYTICLFWDAAAKAWLRAILDLGHPGGRLANDDFSGQTIFVNRHSQKTKAGYVDFFGVCADSNLPAPPQIERQDVRPYLMKRWGCDHEAAYFAPRAVQPIQAVLPLNAGDLDSKKTQKGAS